MLCTTLLPDEVESIVSCKWLCSDGVIKTEYSQLINIYSEVPDIPKGYTCMEIVFGIDNFVFIVKNAIMI